MTNVWGPMAWMTLHSISLNYPENPTKEDKAILVRFMELFTETISCPSCKNHFQILYQSYIANNPNWASSRYNFAIFVMRAHNTVNKRLDKPVLPSVAACVSAISLNTQTTSASSFREQYLVYLLRNWTREYSADSFIAARAVREMIKINAEYWNPRNNTQQVFFPETDVVTPIEPTKGPRGNPLPGFNRSGMPISVGFRIRGGKLSLGSR